MMALAALLVTVLVGILCVAANASDFGPMRGLLALVQLALVVVREVLMAVLIFRQAGWLALLYLAAAGAAFLCLLASQHGYGNLPDYARTLTPFAAFGVPLASLLVAQWRHSLSLTFLAAAIVACAAVSVHIVPQILRIDAPAPVPLPANAPLEAFWPYFKGAARGQIISVLEHRPTLEPDLIAAMRSAEPLEILHAFDYIVAVEPLVTPSLTAAFQAARQTLTARVTPQTETAWRIRTRQAEETLGLAVP